MAEVNMDTSEDKPEEAEIRHKTNMVFMINKLPEDQKAAVEADVEQILRQKLQDGGHTVLKVERGKKRYMKPNLHMMAFISIEVEDEEKLPEIITAMNAASGWECFEMVRKKPTREGDQGPRMNVVLCIDEIPEEQKAGLESEKLVEFVMEKLKEGGHEVLSSRRGHTKFENMIFLSVKHEDEATLPGLVAELNSKFWNGFEVSRDWWKEQRSKPRVPGQQVEKMEQVEKGPETNVVFFISKIPEDVKNEMINDDSMLSMDFAKFIETKLVEKGLEVLKCNQGPLKSSHIVFLNINHENKETLPELVDDLNKEFWGCFEIGNKKKRGKIFCEVCDVTLRNEHLMEVHKNGKAHLKKLKKVDENGVAKTYKCEICLVYTNDQNGLDVHMKGKNHQKKVSQQERKTYKCNLCCVTTSSEAGLEIHVQGKQHKKRAEADTLGANGNNITVVSNTQPFPNYSVPPVTVTPAPLVVKQEVVAKPPVVVSNGAAKPPVVGGGGFSCELCGITATSNDSLNMHLLGAKHKKKLSAGAKRKNNGMEEYIEKEIKKIKQENGAAAEVKMEIA